MLRTQERGSGEEGRLHLAWGGHAEKRSRGASTSEGLWSLQGFPRLGWLGGWGVRCALAWPAVGQHLLCSSREKFRSRGATWSDLGRQQQEGLERGLEAWQGAGWGCGGVSEGGDASPAEPTGHQLMERSKSVCPYLQWDYNRFEKPFVSRLEYHAANTQWLILLCFSWMFIFQYARKVLGS